MNNKTILYLFFTDAILNIIAIITASEILNYITKPLLMVLLGWYLYKSAPQNRFTKTMLFGVLFSIGGDTALMFQGNSNFFIVGLISFLIAHIYYIIGMYRFPNFKSGLLFKKWWLGLPLTIYGFILVYMLWAGLGEMRIPVMVYSSVIMLMGLSAINMFGRTHEVATQLLLVGASLFIFSDSVIAINKFGIEGFEIPFPSLIIMVTYISGQYLIAKSVISATSKLDKS